MDLDTFFGSSLGQGVTMVPGDSAGYPHWHGHCGSVAGGYQQGLGGDSDRRPQQLQEPQTST